MKVHPFYFSEIREINYCDTKLIYFSGNDYREPTPVISTITEHNIDTCEGCKTHHQLLIDEVAKKLDEFPNCCKNHSNLTTFKEFRKSDFVDSPLQNANKIMFSYSHIIHNLDDDNWYDEITNYIEYCIESYGSVPPNCGIPFELGNYFSGLLHLLKHIDGTLISDKVDNDELAVRFKVIVTYLKTYFENHEKNAKNLEKLMGIYNDWYKLFPFELEYFKHLKSGYNGKMPFFVGEKFNKYLNIKTSILHSKVSLIKSLTTITEEIITTINGLKLYQAGKLSNFNAIDLQLILEHRKMELTQITQSKDPFYKILSKWFIGEKRFISEITPKLNNEVGEDRQYGDRPNRTDIAFYLHYMQVTNSLKLTNPFPSGAAYDEIEKTFKKNGKNIQHVYNLISNNSEKRLAASKIRNISYVITEMLASFPIARKLAQDELKLAELNL
jgi:hypothetical protein